MAVRGALRQGVLPAGGWGLIRCIIELQKTYNDDTILGQVLVPSLKQPIFRLLANIGLNEEESKVVYDKLYKLGFQHPYNCDIYDAWEDRFVDAYEAGLLDSTPAVLEAIRNSLSIASLLGTLGGAVVFKRDHELERQEARANEAFLRDAGLSAADERA